MTWTSRARRRRNGPAVPGPLGVRGVLGARVGAPSLVALSSLLVLLMGTWLGVARVVVHQCLRLDGPIGVLGLRMQLLQDVADCPDGTLAVMPGAPQGMVLAFSLALPVVAGWTALGAVGAALLAVVVRAVRSVSRVLRSVVRHLPEPPATRPVDGTDAAVVPVRWERVPLPVVLGPRHPRRGPPLALA
jgi:hypothetical protein